ncbi:MAG: CARDB domain-containing protein, partial [Saprospiraceae bacterium]
TSFTCQTSPGSTTSEYQMNGLTIGGTYYIRFYTYDNLASTNFTICIGTPPPPPANDECANATLLTVNPDLNCATTLAATTSGALQSQAACSGTADDDVWFKFVAAAASHRVKVTGISGWAVLQPFSGACGALTSFTCQTSPGSTTSEYQMDGLTIGGTYYIRFYTYDNLAYTNFNICIGTPVPPPANDNCSGATLLTVNSDANCGTVLNASTLGATQSQAPCQGTSDDDVWFKFIATGATQRVLISNATQAVVSQVFSGSCGSLTSLDCKTGSNGTDHQLFGLTAGQTYYLRVYTQQSLLLAGFSVCVTNVCSPNAALIASAPVLTCTIQSITLTASGGENYTWDNGSTDTSRIVSSPGLYSVSITGIGGCIVVKSIAIGMDTIPQGSITGTNYICQSGGSTTLTASGGASYFWSTGATTAAVTVSPTVSTLYSVTITGSNGCTKVDTMTVHLYLNTPVPDKVSAMFPANNSINVPPNATLSWQPASNASTYDLYYWVTGGNTNYTGPDNSIQRSVSLSYNSTIYWAVQSINACYTRFGDTLTFTTTGLPDLIVDSVSFSTPVFSGTPLTITYRVKNIGTASTGGNAWNDRIWLSSDEDLRLADDDLLAVVPNQTYLLPGQSYVQTKTVQLPTSLLGIQHLFVITNVVDAFCTPPCTGNRSHHSAAKITEITTQNNFLDSLINITPSQTPNFEVDSVTHVPSTVMFSGQAVEVSWTVKNTGGVPYIQSMQFPYYVPWTDSVYISHSPVLDQTANLLAPIDPTRIKLTPPIGITNQPFNYTIPAGGSSRFTKQYRVPYNFYGTYYIHVRGDATDVVFEGVGGNIDNDASSDSLVVNILPPSDLSVSTTNAPFTIPSGTGLDITYSTVNNSSVATNVSSWTDLVYISTLPAFIVDSALLIGTYVRGAVLGGNATYNGSASKMLPPDILGYYYVYVYTDAYDHVHEYGGPVADYNANNLQRSAATFQITPAPTPDFIVSYASLDQDTIAADSLFNLNLQIKNQGTGAQAGDFQYQIDVLNPTTGDSVWTFGLFTVNGLGVGDSVARIQPLLTPPLSAGLYSLRIKVDPKNQVFERNGENNNSLNSDTVPAIPRAVRYCDLSAEGINIQGAASSGQSLQINTNIANVGLFPSTGDSVYVYWSYTPGDIAKSNLLYSRASTVAINSSQSANIAASVKMPNGVSGTVYLILKVVALGLNPDEQPTNNLSSTPINVTLSPSPDFFITAMSAPDSVYAGQQFTIYYTVQNQGSAPASGNLIHRAYLSSAPGAYQYGSKLGFKNKMINLAPGASFSDSLTTQTNVYDAGSYYLLLETESLNQWYEHNGEANNFDNEPILVIPTSSSPADLQITAVSDPRTSILLGERDTVTLQVINIGTGPTSGILRSGVYFSADSLYSSDEDYLLALKDTSILLAAGATLTTRVSGVVKDIVGTFYHLGRTNLKATVPENNFANNTAPGPGIAIDVEALSPIIWDTASLMPDQCRYYKIAVDSAKDLRIRLEQINSMAGVNRVLVAYNRVPNVSDYDVDASAAQAGQIALVPNTRPGTYYILELAQTQYPNVQSVRTRAEVLPFSIQEISPSVVGQGLVSTTILGAGFRFDTLLSMMTQVELQQGGVVQATGTITHFSSSMEMRVLWDLTNVAVGTYDLVLTNPNSEEAALIGAVQVEVPEEPFISVDAIFPPAIRFGRSGYLSFYYKNTSNVDVDLCETGVLLPENVVVSNLTLDGNGFTISELYDVEENWTLVSGYKNVKLLLKDIAPEEQVALSFKISNADRGVLDVSYYTAPMTYTEYIRDQESFFEEVRQDILGEPVKYDNESQLLALANDKMTFRDNFFLHYIDKGLYDSQRVMESLNALCPTCETSYSYTPGGSNTSGTSLINGNLTLVPDERILWEIAVPFGLAGDKAGWDLLRLNGVLNITATPAQPVWIDIHSINPCTGDDDFLTTWEPWHGYRWPFAYAMGGITGFDAAKFNIHNLYFNALNETHGGQFVLEKSGDTLFVVFVSTTAVEKGYDGGPGSCGYRGGNGGPGGAGFAGGDGGAGSDGLEENIPGGPFGPGAGGAGGFGGINGPGGGGGPGGAGTRNP